LPTGIADAKYDTFCSTASHRKVEVEGEGLEEFVVL